jgi:hypothetical protein
MPKLPPPRETPPPRRRPPYITGYSAYQLRRSRSLRHRTVPNGEVAEAYMGIQGLNSRKGIRSRDDLLDELADVIITAAVAMTGVAEDVDQAYRHFERRIKTVTARAGLQLSASADA